MVRTHWLASSNMLTVYSAGAWTNLEIFSAGDSLIRGTIPSTLSAWTNLKVFSIPRAEMVGIFPDEIADQWVDLEFLDISVNAFSGTIPSGMTKWTMCETFWLENNQFTGTVPFCDIYEQYWGLLSTDCEALNCTCCTLCCPGSFLDIPMYSGCLTELESK